MSICDFCEMAPAFCDGDVNKCAVAFIEMTDQSAVEGKANDERTWK